METLEFEGNGSEYFKIWIVNVLLVILTAGLYYPWAKVRNHRYFYGNTTLDGRNFEYHATGKQLFLGYIIAMVLFIIYIVIQQISPIGSLIVLGVLFIAIPWLVWRSLKFSLKMTSFSNVHFGFTGTLKQSYINFFLYPLVFLCALYILPIGLTVALPMLSGVDTPSWLSLILPVIILLSMIVAFYMFALMKKKNTSYILNGTRYGQGVFETTLETKKFAMILLRTLGLSVLILGFIALLIGAVVYGTIGLESLMEMQNAMKDPQSMPENIGSLIPIIFTAYAAMILASMVIIAYSMTRQRSYVYEHTTLDDKITFASSLEARPLIWVMISNLLLVIVTFGFAYPWAKVRMTKLMVENTLVDTSYGFDDYITERQEEESSLGEQIGDAFDVDVGLGF